MSIESVMPSSHLILCHPLLLLPPTLPASESFPVSQLFTWSGQSTGVSALASFLPKKSQGWSPSEWTGWISHRYTYNSSLWTSLPSPAPSHSSRLIHPTPLEPLIQFPEPYSKFPFAVYFTEGNNFHVTLSILLTLSAPSPCPLAYSLCLFLDCCPVNKFFSTIFLDSTFMRCCCCC